MSKIQLLQSWLKKHKVSYGQALKLLSDIRVIKKNFEIKKLRENQKLTKKIFKKLKKLLCLGITEKETTEKIKKLAEEEGADMSFSPIVSFGENTQEPHHFPTVRKLKKNDIVMIDMGIKKNGYCSDYTRTLLPKNPTNEMKKIYNLVFYASRLAVKKIKLGMELNDVDKIARNAIKKAGYGEYFIHSLGHGIGVYVHEEPIINAKCRKKNTKLKVEKGMVFSVEPGIYLPGKFGVRIEDLVAVTSKGVEIL